MIQCNCHVCTMSRRRRELDKAPTIEAYQSYCDDLSKIWLNESLKADIEIINLREKLEALQSPSIPQVAP